jgi:hypothetical protein
MKVFLGELGPVDVWTMKFRKYKMIAKLIYFHIIIFEHIRQYYYLNFAIHSFPIFLAYRTGPKLYHWTSILYSDIL